MAIGPKFVFGLQNFRSIQAAGLNMRPVTVLTGANGAGKSSFMYGLMALKNLLVNSNQSADNFFNLGFVSLGGFKEVVAGKDTLKSIRFSAQYSDASCDSAYTVDLGATSRLNLVMKRPFSLALSLNISFPYPLVQSVTQEVAWGDRTFKLSFNGIAVTAANAAPLDTSAVPEGLIRTLDLALIPATIARMCDYVDVKRGFFRNTYAIVPAGVTQSNEEAVASMLAGDRDLEARVSVTLEKMLNKSFSVRPTTLGAPTFYLQTVDRETGFVCDLVNEGFGVNQLVYLLAKVLQKDSWVVCVEEPETHLHPEALTKLAEQLLNIAKRDSKRLLISSHSEHFVVALLNLVAQGKASPEDIGIYFVAKDAHNRTAIAEQSVNGKGQIEGGLRSFYEPSIRALEEFFGPEPEKENADPAKRVGP
ncbi:MAG TPA: AAA family ATPase [Candidatus Saccharimonadales bacterium]|jgi:hypothetical protein|nr:AAA family ATPase [Candidatus Saccharimonadales bacterium]